MFDPDLSRSALRTVPALQYQLRCTLSGGKPVAAEAVARLPHRRRGAEEPAGWLLHAACAEARHWRAAQVSVAVNEIQIHGPLHAQVAAALEASAMPPDRLELSFAEAALASADEDALFALAALRDLGVGLMISDFGSDTGALLLVRRLPLMALRLGRALTRDMSGGAEDAALLRAIADAARAFGLHLVADGVETEVQRDFLASCGWEQGQGGLYGAALEARTVRALMR